MKNYFLECGYWPEQRQEEDGENHLDAGGVSAVAVRRILVIFFCGIGDMVVFIPALEELGRFFGRARVSVMASPPADQVLIHHPRVNAVFTIEALRRKNFLSRFDFIINLSGGDRKINDMLRRSNVKHLLIKQRLFDKKYPFHASEYHLELVKEIKALFDKPLVYLAGAERRAAIRYLRRIKLDPKKDLTIAVHPGAGNPRKNWDWRRFAKACDLLTRDHGATILLLSGPEERELCLRIARKSTGRIVVVQEPLRLVAALLECCALLIANDSGVMHLAAAVGVPVVCLFSASVSQPDVWGPLADNHLVIYKGTHAAITVEEVMQGVRLLLRRKSKIQGQPPARSSLYLI
ncbi:MAG TPA: glycosyltransferase family 9 protein [bacterium]|nr:glycosyltransferase family 9 protein [bacterium]